MMPQDGPTWIAGTVSSSKRFFLKKTRQLFTRFNRLISTGFSSVFGCYYDAKIYFYLDCNFFLGLFLIFPNNVLRDTL